MNTHKHILEVAGVEHIDLGLSAFYDKAHPRFADFEVVTDENGVPGETFPGPELVRYTSKGRTRTLLLIGAEGGVCELAPWVDAGTRRMTDAELASLLEGFDGFVLSSVNATTKDSPLDFVWFAVLPKAAWIAAGRPRTLAIHGLDCPRVGDPPRKVE